MKQKQDLYYRLDPKDLIVEVGGAWNDFAKLNDGHRILAGHIEGQSLFSHITGDSTQMMMDVLLARVRRQGKPLTRPYRCDSPTLKRYMEMTIEPDEFGFLNLRHRLLKSEPLESQLAIKTFSSGIQGHTLVIRCSVCNRFRLGDNWLELEVAKQQGLSSDGGTTRVAYGVCSDCQNMYSSER